MRRHVQFYNLQPGSVIAEKYTIERLITTGGMSGVFEVSSEGSRYAMKIMDPKLVQNKKLRRRFEIEIQIAEELTSRHAVRVYDHGIDESRDLPFLVMELLEGKSLGAVVHENGPLSFPETKYYLSHICEVLHEAHRRGYVHRDLKPDNIMITAQHEAKVVDFGLARIVSEFCGPSSAEFGTPGWTAPEQLTASGGPITPATDVWALGLLAFYMLTGRQYWLAANEPSSTMIRISMEICSAAPLEVASARAKRLGSDAKITPHFDDWFSRCVARDINARMQDAEQAFKELTKLKLLSKGTPKPPPAYAPQVLSAYSSSSLSSDDLTIEANEEALIAQAAEALKERSRRAIHARQSAFLEPPIHQEPSAGATDVQEPAEAASDGAQLPVPDACQQGQTPDLVVADTPGASPFPVPSDLTIAPPTSSAVLRRRRWIERVLVASFVTLIAGAVAAQCIVKDWLGLKRLPSNSGSHEPTSADSSQAARPPSKELSLTASSLPHATAPSASGPPSASPSKPSKESAPREPIEIAASDPTTRSSIAVYGEEVVWTSNNKLLKVSADGSRTFEVLASNEASPSGVVADDSGIYWITNGASIKKWEQGKEVIILASKRAYIHGMVLYRDSVWWTEEDFGRVMSVPKAGGLVKTILTTATKPKNMATDGVFVFWTNSNGTITQFGDTPKTIAFGLKGPHGIAADSSFVYFTEERAQTIGRVAINSGDATTLASGHAAGWSLALDSQYVYWTTESEGLVMRVSKGGGAPEVVVRGQDNPSCVAVSQEAVFWVNAKSGRVYKLSK